MKKLLISLGALFLSVIASAQIPINNLPAATQPLNGNDLLIVQQGNSSRKAPVSAITSLAPPISATYLLQSSNALLTNSRTLGGALNEIILTDGGPGGILAISTPQAIGLTSTPTFGGLTLTGLNGILLGNGSSPLSTAVASNIVTLFSGCSGILSLGADGACHAAGGTPGGAANSAQYNNAGAFGGISLAADTLLQGSATSPQAVSVPNCGSGTQALDYSTATHLFGCQTITVPVGANPTATLGLSAVNGTAATFLRSDAAPALSQSISPTWTGVHVFSRAPTFNVPAGDVFTINNTNTSSFILGGSTPGSSAGLTIAAGLNSVDLPLHVEDQTQTTDFLIVLGDGSVVVGQPSGAGKGLGSINAQTIFQDNVPVVTEITTTQTATVTTGCASGTATVVTTQHGNVVDGYIEPFTCTANATGLVLSGALPVAPARSQVAATVPFEDNGAATSACVFTFASGTTLSFLTGFASGCVTAPSATGTKGLTVDSVKFSYLVN